MNNEELGERGYDGDRVWVSGVGSWPYECSGDARILGFLGFAFGALFDTHVLQFARLEDLAALQALHELSVLFATHDLHARMLAGWLAGVGRMRERL